MYLSCNLWKLPSDIRLLILFSGASMARQAIRFMDSLTVLANLLCRIPEVKCAALAAIYS